MNYPKTYTVTTYKNPWYAPAQSTDPELYRTQAEPVERDGTLMYNRIPGSGKGRGCWDFVLNGVCIYQMGGPNGQPWGWHKTAVTGGVEPFMAWLVEIGAIEPNDEQFNVIREKVRKNYEAHYIDRGLEPREIAFDAMMDGLR